MQRLTRSNLPQVFLGKYFLKICSKLAGEHPCQSVVSIKLHLNCMPKRGTETLGWDPAPGTMRWDHGVGFQSGTMGWDPRIGTWGGTLGWDPGVKHIMYPRVIRYQCTHKIYALDNLFHTLFLRIEFLPLPITKNLC